MKDKRVRFVLFCKGNGPDIKKKNRVNLIPGDSVDMAGPYISQKGLKPALVEQNLR